ncbi:hypothetical protein AAMO2058_000276100 [Amorphochlora amoebiformis]
MATGCLCSRPVCAISWVLCTSFAISYSNLPAGILNSPLSPRFQVKGRERGLAWRVRAPLRVWADREDNRLTVDLLKLSSQEMEDLLVSWGEPKFRAKQLYKAIYDQGVRDFSEITALPIALRGKLNTSTSLGTLRIAKEKQSKDGTIKRAYSLHDDKLIESVLMPYDDGRFTACISSQAGCAQGCVFCATGQMGFTRHLTSDEIFEQAFRFSQELKAEGRRLTNIVFMGMGEPFANFDNVVRALERIHDQLGIGWRHLTVSTVGIVPKIYEFADKNMQVTLAVSLHAASNEVRGALMPVNRRWDVYELMQACKYYVLKTNRRITFEWASIEGENDSKADANQLAELLKGLRCHVNVIPVNPTKGYAGHSSVSAARRFVESLESLGIPATLRVRRGIDIDGGCGQLTVAMEDQSSQI